MSGYVPLEVEQYATFSRVITIRTATGVAQNLSGYTASSKMRKSHYATTANTITTVISDASNGEITLSITAANTGLLTPGRYVYDVVTVGGGVTQRMIEGIIVVNPGVTY
jgi:spermidine/putrescine-binding protein